MPNQFPCQAVSACPSQFLDILAITITSKPCVRHDTIRKPILPRVPGSDPEGTEPHTFPTHQSLVTCVQRHGSNYKTLTLSSVIASDRSPSCRFGQLLSPDHCVSDVNRHETHHHSALCPSTGTLLLEPCPASNLQIAGTTVSEPPPRGRASQALSFFSPAAPHRNTTARSRGRHTSARPSLLQ